MNYRILKDDQGATMIIVMVLLAATGLLTLGVTMVGSVDTRLSGNYRDTTAGFFAAEAGVHHAISELRKDNAWNAGFTGETLPNGADYNVTVTQVGTYEKVLTSYGHYNGGERVVEVRVNTDSAFAHSINAGGDLFLYANPVQTSIGIRANKRVLLDLQAVHPTLNVHNPDPTNNITVVGSDTHVVGIQSPELDVEANRLTEAQWEELATAADSTYYFDNDGVFGNSDTDVRLDDFNCDDVPADSEGKKTVFVDGNLTLTDTLEGHNCTLIATGKIHATGSTEGETLVAAKSKSSVISMLAKGDIQLDLDLTKHNELSGLIYTESDYQVTGKFTFNGVVTALGNAYIGTTEDFNNTVPKKYWHYYSSAYNILFDEVDIITWRERHPGIS